MKGTKVAWVAALIALVLAATLAAVRPAEAADPNPPYVAKSQPGNLELYGIHGKQLSATVRAWVGLQRCRNGDYRPWVKGRGDGKRRLSLSVTGLYFFEGANSAGPGSGVRGPATTAYYVGLCRPVQDLAVVILKVKARYESGHSTGDPECLESYTIRRGRRAPHYAPTRGC